MSTIVKRRSRADIGSTSPKPTVEMVVTVWYSAFIGEKARSRYPIVPIAVMRPRAARPSRARRRASTGGILPHPPAAAVQRDENGSGRRWGRGRAMDGAALVVWLLTAGGGLTMGSIWLARGGLRQRDEVLESSYVHAADATDLPVLPPPPQRSRLPVWAISTHASLALLGLVLGLYYRGHDGEEGTGVGAAPPLVVAVLLMVAGLGALMVRRWREDRSRLDADGVPKAERPP